MINTYVLSEEQLDFIRFMSKAEICTPELKNRVDGCVKKSLQNKDTCNRVPQKLHIPLMISNFLVLFTKQDTALRYITHTWDANQFENYETFEEQYARDLKMQEIWKSNLRQDSNSMLYMASNRLFYLIYNFLLNPAHKRWHDTYDIRIGFKNISLYIKEWMNKNQGSQPSDMPLTFLPEEIRPTGLWGDKILLKFGDVIEIFRKSICFKGSEFYSLVRRVFNRGEFNLDENGIQSLRGISFYTDTQRIEDAIRRVAKNCLDYKHFNKIKISGELKDSNYTITILQKDSFSDCQYNDDKIQLRGKGDMIDIKKSLQSLCDFSVRSRFRNDKGELATATISYLYDRNFDAMPRVSWSEETCDGFEYIFKFYLA